MDRELKRTDTNPRLLTRDTAGSRSPATSNSLGSLARVGLRPLPRPPMLGASQTHQTQQQQQMQQQQKSPSTSSLGSPRPLPRLGIRAPPQRNLPSTPPQRPLNRINPPSPAGTFGSIAPRRKFSDASVSSIEDPSNNKQPPSSARSPYQRPPIGTTSARSTPSLSSTSQQDAIGTTPAERPTIRRLAPPTTRLVGTRRPMTPITTSSNILTPARHNRSLPSTPTNSSPPTSPTARDDDDREDDTTMTTQDTSKDDTIPRNNQTGFKDRLDQLEQAKMRLMQTRTNFSSPSLSRPSPVISAAKPAPLLMAAKSKSQPNLLRLSPTGVKQDETEVRQAEKLDTTDKNIQQPNSPRTAKEVKPDVVTENFANSQRAETDRLNEELEKVKAELERLKKENRRLHDENADQDETIASLTNEKNRLVQENESVQQERDKLVDENKHFQTELKNVRKDLDGKVSELDRAEHARLEVQAELTEKTRALEELLQQHDDMSADLSQTKKELEKERERSLSFENAMANMNAEVTRMEDELSRSREASLRFNNAFQESSQLREENRQLQNTCSAFERQLAQLTRQLDAADMDRRHLRKVAEGRWTERELIDSLFLEKENLELTVQQLENYAAEIQLTESVHEHQRVVLEEKVRILEDELQGGFSAEAETMFQYQENMMQYLEQYEEAIADIVERHQSHLENLEKMYSVREERQLNAPQGDPERERILLRDLEQAVENEQRLQEEMNGILKEFDRLTMASCEFENDRLRLQGNIKRLENENASLRERLDDATAEKLTTTELDPSTEVTVQSMRKELRRLLEQSREESEKRIQSEVQQRVAVERELMEYKRERAAEAYVKSNQSVQTIDSFMM